MGPRREGAPPYRVRHGSIVFEGNEIQSKAVFILTRAATAPEGAMRRHVGPLQDDPSRIRISASGLRGSFAVGTTQRRGTGSRENREGRVRQTDRRARTEVGNRRLWFTRKDARLSQGRSLSGLYLRRQRRAKDLGGRKPVSATVATSKEGAGSCGRPVVQVRFAFAAPFGSRQSRRTIRTQGIPPVSEPGARTRGVVNPIHPRIRRRRDREQASPGSMLVSASAEGPGRYGGRTFQDRAA